MNWLSDDINKLALLAAVLILTISTIIIGKYVKQMKNDKSTGELIDKEWDGIKEYKNELPIGWAVSFLVLMVWAFWYLTTGYPVNSFSQIGQWNEEVAQKNAEFTKKWINPDKETLLGMGESIFLVQCAPCHGITGDGIDGKSHDFTTRISKDQVAHVIKNGGNNLVSDYPGGMPPMMLTEAADIEEVSAYVAGGFKGEQPATYAACAGCHGEDGKGMPYVAPNIVDYDTSLVAAVLNNGKKGNIGIMPKFDDGRLTDIQKKAVGHFIQTMMTK